MPKSIARRRAWHWIAAMVVAAGFCGAAAADVLPQVVLDARHDAALDLLKQVAAEPLSNGSTVGETILAGPAPQTMARDLLAGVEEQQPAPCYGDRSCVVTLRLSREQLAKNVAAALARGAKAGAEMPTLTRPAKGMLAAAATVREPATGPQATDWPPRDLRGWGEVGEEARVALDNKALDAARTQFREAALALPVPGNGTVKTFLQKSEAAQEKFLLFLKRVPAQEKIYLPGGLVTVRIVQPVGKVVDELIELNGSAVSEKSRLSKETVEALRKAAADRGLTGVGCAAASGKAETPTETYVALAVGDIPNVQLPEKKEAKKEAASEESAAPAPAPK